jgi:hypothetical protein
VDSTVPLHLAGGGTEQTQPEDCASMSIDSSSSLQHRRFGFDADHSQAAHVAILCAGFSQCTQIGAERRCAAAQCPSIHIRVTPSIDVADQPWLWVGLQLQ